jgi:hypothetical protein
MRNPLGLGFAALAVITCDISTSRDHTVKNGFEKYGIYSGSYLQTFPDPPDSLISIIYKVEKDTMILSVHNIEDDCTRSEITSLFKVSSDSICFDSGKYRYAVSGSCLQPSDTLSSWPSSCTILRNIGPDSFEIYQHEESISGTGSVWVKLLRQ